MLFHPALARSALVACFILATLGAASAQNPNANTATAALDRHCHDWGSTLKKIASSSSTEAQRDAAIRTANQDLHVQLLVVDIPANDFASLTSKLKTCLENEGKAAFGTGTSVVVSLNPTNQKKQPIPSSVISATVQVSPGNTVVTVVANKSLGREWGDKCLAQGSMPCCQASAQRECKSTGLCRLAIKMCETMVTCNKTLNDCKKKTMDDPKKPDPKCDGAACKQCTADYKKCHDAAVALSN